MPASSKGATNPHLLSHVRVGDELEVWWPLDNAYYSGVVGAVLPAGRHRVCYADGDVEELVLAAEQWRFRGAAAERVTAALLHGVPPGPSVAEQEVDGSDVSSEALASAAARESTTVRRNRQARRDRK